MCGLTSANTRCDGAHREEISRINVVVVIYIVLVIMKCDDGCILAAIEESIILVLVVSVWIITLANGISFILIMSN